MSEREKPETNDPRDERDRDWLCALLDEPALAVAVADVDAADSEAGARCEYLAVLGLLAEAHEPVEPSPGLKGRILAAAGVGEVAASAAAPVNERIRRPVRRWLLPLAATVAVAALTLSAWQSLRLSEARAVIDRQASDLAAAREVAERLARMEGENAEQRAALSLLTAAGAEFCPLRPPAASPTPEAYGALAMSADGAHWYVRVVGLEQRAGYEYRLWFLRDGEPVDVAVLPGVTGDSMEMMNGEAPEGFNSVALTLEPAGSDRPSGPRVLFGDQRMRIL